MFVTKKMKLAAVMLSIALLAVSVMALASTLKNGKNADDRIIERTDGPASNGTALDDGCMVFMCDLMLRGFGSGLPSSAITVKADGAAAEEFFSSLRGMGIREASDAEYHALIDSGYFRTFDMNFSVPVFNGELQEVCRLSLDRNTQNGEWSRFITVYYEASDGFTDTKHLIIPEESFRSEAFESLADSAYGGDLDEYIAYCGECGDDISYETMAERLPNADLDSYLAIDPNPEYVPDGALELFDYVDFAAAPEPEVITVDLSGHGFGIMLTMPIGDQRVYYEGSNFPYPFDVKAGDAAAQEFFDRLGSLKLERIADNRMDLYLNEDSEKFSDYHELNVYDGEHRRVCTIGCFRSRDTEEWSSRIRLTAYDENSEGMRREFTALDSDAVSDVFERLFDAAYGGSFESYVEACHERSTKNPGIADYFHDYELAEEFPGLDFRTYFEWGLHDDPIEVYPNGAELVFGKAE